MMSELFTYYSKGINFTNKRDDWHREGNIISSLKGRYRTYKSTHYELILPYYYYYYITLYYYYYYYTILLYTTKYYYIILIILY